LLLARGRDAGTEEDLKQTAEVIPVLRPGNSGLAE
jgi:hypothetical protein